MRSISTALMHTPIMLVTHTVVLNIRVALTESPPTDFSTSGVTIAGTLSGSPAANAGLGEGDEITALGGQSVSTAEDISQALVKYHPGDSISVTWTDTSGQSHTSNLTLASGPSA